MLDIFLFSLACLVSSIRRIGISTHLRNRDIAAIHIPMVYNILRQSRSRVVLWSRGLSPPQRKSQTRCKCDLLSIDMSNNITQLVAKSGECYGIDLAMSNVMDKLLDCSVFSTQSCSNFLPPRDLFFSLSPRLIRSSLTHNHWQLVNGLSIHLSLFHPLPSNIFCERVFIRVLMNHMIWVH